MDTAPELPPAAAPEAPKPLPAGAIPLETPIKRGETSIDFVNLRRPSAGEMRGLQLQQLVQGDVNNILGLLPRITVPPLTSHEVDQLDPADLAALCGEVQGFFMTKSDQAAMARALGAIAQETPTG